MSRTSTSAPRSSPTLATAPSAVPAPIAGHPRRDSLEAATRAANERMARAARIAAALLDTLAIRNHFDFDKYLIKPEDAPILNREDGFHVQHCANETLRASDAAATVKEFQCVHGKEYPCVFAGFLC